MFIGLPQEKPVNIKHTPSIMNSNQRNQQRIKNQRERQKEHAIKRVHKQLIAELEVEQQSIRSTIKETLEAKEHIDELLKALSHFRDKVESAKKLLKVYGNGSPIDGLVERFEGLILFIMRLSRSKTLAEVVLDCVTYAKTFIRGSASVKVIAFIRQILTPDEKSVGFQAGWMTDNWETLIKGHFGSRISSVLNLLIALGMMPDKASTLCTKEFYNVFDLKSKRKQSQSIFEMVCNTVDFTIDSVYPALVHCDLSYLMGDKDKRDLDEIYRDTLDACDKHHKGLSKENKKLHDISDEADLLVKLDNCIIAHSAFNRHKDPRLRSEINKRIIQLDKLSNDLQSGWHESNSRVKPFGILMRGGSSVGKTTLVHSLNHLICHINGFPEGEEYTCFLNGDDQFQSEFTSHHITAVFDDMCNTRPEKEQTNPLFKLIQFLNNVHCAALSPIAEQKGKNDIRVRLVIVTTNTLDLHSSFFSCNPTSIMRRFNLIIDVALKSEASNGVDGIKSEYAGQSMPDIWDLKYHTVGIKHEGDLADSWHTIRQPGSDIVDLATYLRNTTIPYYATQNALVKASTNLHKQPHCETHGDFTVPCPACAKSKKSLDIVPTQIKTKKSEFVSATTDIEWPSSGAIARPVREGSWNEVGKQAGSLSEFLARFKRLEDIMEEPSVEEIPYEDFDIHFPDHASEEEESFQSVHTNTEQLETHTVVSRESSFAQSSKISTISTTSSSGKSIWRKKVKTIKRSMGFFKKKKPKEKPVDPIVDEALEDDALRNFLALGDQNPPHEMKTKKGMLFRCVGENGFYWKQEVTELAHSEKLPPRSRFSVVCAVAKRNFTSLKEFGKEMYDKLAATDPKYKALLAFSLILTSAGVAYSLKQALEPQSSILTEMNVSAMSPSMMADHDDRYKRALTFAFPVPSASTSTTREAFDNKMDKNLRLATVTEINPVTRNPVSEPFCLNACPLGEGDWAFPNHVFKPGKTYDVFMQNAPRNEIVKHIHFLANDSNITPLPYEKDACIVNVCGGGSNWKLDKYLLACDYNLKVGQPLEIYFQHPDNVFKGDLSKVPSKLKVHTKINNISTINVKGLGHVKRIHYDFAPGTYQGLCGAVITLGGLNPIVLGFHNAGEGKLGVCSLISKKLVDDARTTRHFSTPPIKYADDSNPLPNKMQDVPITIVPTVHGRNPAVWMETSKVHCADIIGSCATPNATFKTDVKESCIAKALEEKMGIKKEHAGPDKNGVSKMRHEHLDSVICDQPPVDPRILEYAKQDFMTKLENFENQVDIKPFIHSLSKDDAINGVPGVKGFDPVDINTSIGHPINKKKSMFLAIDNELKEKYGIETKKCIREVVTEDGSIGIVASIEFDPAKYDLDKILDETLELMVEGERVNFCFRSNLKDEALPLEKVEAGKIRVFAGAPFPLVVICRMLTLPAINVMKNFPDVYESAVGIDASGKDWQHLFNYVTQFGKENMIAGDFKKYDQMTPSAFTSTSLSILKGMLERSGNFSENQMKIFDSMATEIISPLYEINGLLINTNKSVASGHPLTVILNGLNNSLFMRYAYYANYARYEPETDIDPIKGNIPLFHTVVALITYGDDNLMSVSPKCKWFTHTTIAERLAEIGMIYTMADKTEESQAFINIAQCSFLKRTFVQHPLLDNAIVAPLEIDSIHKSLTCTKHQKGAQESEAQVMALNMGVALYELFQHGEDIFNKYRDGFELLREVEDSKGNKIDTYYEPPTIDDCISRYKNTTNRYQFVQEKYPYTLTQQAGADVLDAVSDVTGVTNVFQLAAFHVPLGGSDLEPDQVYTIPQLISHGFFQATEEEPDYRDDHNLGRLIRKQCFRFSKIRRLLRRNAVLSRDLFEYAGTNREFIADWKWDKLRRCHSADGTSKAYNCVEKIVAKRKVSFFPPDIADYIGEFSKSNVFIIAISHSAYGDDPRFQLINKHPVNDEDVIGEMVIPRDYLRQCVASVRNA